MFSSLLLAPIAVFLTVVSAQVPLSSLTSGPATVSPGSSTLGTLQQNAFPKSPSSTPIPQDFSLRSKIPRSFNPNDPPTTGVTRYYDFTISRGTAAPDGFLRPAILINNQFPGPLIEANWGDEIQVTVHNEITGPEEGTTIHWHGQLQKGTPWMDGVPSLTQCPIAPGSSFTYRFQAATYGTSWYHSHYSSQLIDGIFGPLVVYGPSHVPFDEDLGPILIQDYFHTPYAQLTQDIMSVNATLQVQPTDNTLINGRMPYNCSLAPPGSVCKSNAPYSQFHVQAGKTYKLRIINSGAGSLLGFSIDNHVLTIIANDFVDLEPYKTTMVLLGAGQRSDVLFTPKNNGSVWMRAQSVGQFCARSFNSAARAVVLVDNAPANTIPTTSAWPAPADNTCANDPLNETVPYYPEALPPPSVTYNLTINQIVNETGHKLYVMNGVPFQGDYNDPILLLADEKNYSYPLDPKWNVVNFGTNTSIRVNVWNNNTSPHPLHLHGHEMWVLNSGPGQWDGVSIVNPQNPQRRDTHNLIPNGYMVLQYNADNPGTWAFHCHIAFHLSQGLFMTFMERPFDIPNQQIPNIMAETCTDWNAFTSKNVVDQIDSGLKKRQVPKRGPWKKVGERW